MEIEKRPDRKFQAGFTGAPAVAGGNKNKQKSPFLACLLGWVVTNWFLIWGRVRVGVGPGLRPEGWLR